MLPRVAITMGDPAGIGPEICLKTLSHSIIPKICVPIIFGDAEVLDHCAREIDIVGIPNCVHLRTADSTSDFQGPTLVDFETPEITDVRSGELSTVAGQAAYDYVDHAINWTLAGKVDAIVTGPINKLAINNAGHRFPGHTEFLASRTDAPDFCMMQYSEELTCSFVTTHVGYRDVADLLSTQRISNVIRLSRDAVRKIERCEPVITVCGLNPHAGENGLFGNREEESIILPAVEKARSEGINVVGPLPPDTCFIPARRQKTDCFICMYHDQGHIPLKALAFDQAVNVTLGLPIIRTSVDHGTAFDIAGKNLADPSSMIAAVKLAVKLATPIGIPQPHGFGAAAADPVI